MRALHSGLFRFFLDKPVEFMYILNVVLFGTIEEKEEACIKRDW